MSKSKQKTTGQSLAEFALILPLLIFITTGIIDIAHVVFTYTFASNALRDGLRYAQVYGYASDNIAYLDCEAIERTAKNVLFVDEHTVTIDYRLARFPESLPTSRATCEDPDLATKIMNGDMLRIRSEVRIYFITPMLNNVFQDVRFTFSGQRTIIRDIGLANTNPNDTDYDGLDDTWERNNFNGSLSASSTEDPDNDGCFNGCEEAYGTNPNEKDSDFDTLLDYDEIYLDTSNPNNNTSPTLPDTDFDGLDDNEEIYKTYGYATYAVNPDTDDDGFSDGEEVLDYNTEPNKLNPLKKDTDNDRLTDYEEIKGTHGYVTFGSDDDTDEDRLKDGDEVLTHLINPTIKDTDEDRLEDGDEVLIYLSEPDSKHSDADGLEDGDEVLIYQSNPILMNSDSDGWTDDIEVLAEYGHFTRPYKTDSDEDGLPDDEDKLVHGCEPNFGDTDFDGTDDGDEVSAGTDCQNPEDFPGSDWINPDSDDDNLMDSWELNYFSNINLHNGSSDPDGDGCDNECEETNKTHPGFSDTDTDGLSDFEDIFTYFTNPLVADTDGDNLTDGDEVKKHKTQPRVVDTDGEGLKDGEEVNTYTTNPLIVDTDSDKLNDYEELFVYATDPKSADTDKDGLDDFNEITLHKTNPKLLDTDGDTLGDGDELNKHFTNPLVKDTDGDRLEDNFEINTYKTDPNKVDTDGDTLSDYNEIFVHNTNPLVKDTDFDGVDDNVELAKVPATRPNNPIAIIIEDIVVNEPTKNNQTLVINVTVRLDKASPEVTTVNFTTENGTAVAGNRDDYTATTNTLTFPIGTTVRTIPITIRGDNQVEANEIFYVRLSSQTNAYFLNGDTVGQVTMIEMNR